MDLLKMYLKNCYREADGTEGGDNTDTDNDQEKPRTFTQEEVDELIKKRIARERKKFEKDTTQAKEEETSKDKPVDKEPENKKLNEMELKLLCYEHDIAKEFSKKAIALANTYLDDETDLDGALEKVLEDFPQFKKGYEKEDNNKDWGARQGSKPPSTDGVMEAFKKRNPDLKL